MEGDPLLENLDGLLPLDTSSVTSVPANLPAAIEDLCAALAAEPGVEGVDIGRQVCSKFHFGLCCKLRPKLMLMSRC